MWAQGLTIGVLIAAGVMTHARRVREMDEGPVRHLVSTPASFPTSSPENLIADSAFHATQEADHSWKDIVEHEEQARQLAQQRAAARFKADAPQQSNTKPS